MCVCVFVYVFMLFTSLSASISWALENLLIAVECKDEKRDRAIDAIGHKLVSHC